MRLRNRISRFPWFACLIAGEVVQSLVLVLIHHYGSYSSYFYAYWFCDVLDAGIRLGVIWELSKSISEIVRDQKLRRLYRSRDAALISIAVFAAFLAITPQSLSLRQHYALKITIFADGLVGAAILVLFLNIFLYGFEVRSHVGVITYGLFVFTMGRLVVHVGAAGIDILSWRILEHLLKPVYLICLFMWCVCLYLNEPKRLLNRGIEQVLRSKEACKALEIKNTA